MSKAQVPAGPKKFSDTTLRKFYRELRDFPGKTTGKDDAWFNYPVVLKITKPDGDVVVYSDHPNALIDSVVDSMNFSIMQKMGHTYEMELGPRDPSLYAKAVQGIRSSGRRVRRV